MIRRKPSSAGLEKRRQPGLSTFFIGSHGRNPLPFCGRNFPSRFIFHKIETLKVPSRRKLFTANRCAAGGLFCQVLQGCWESQDPGEGLLNSLLCSGEYCSKRWDDRVPGPPLFSRGSASPKQRQLGALDRTEGGSRGTGLWAPRLPSVSGAKLASTGAPCRRVSKSIPAALEGTGYSACSHPYLTEDGRASVLRGRLISILIWLCEITASENVGYPTCPGRSRLPCIVQGWEEIVCFLHISLGISHLHSLSCCRCGLFSFSLLIQCL